MEWLDDRGVPFLGFCVSSILFAAESALGYMLTAHGSFVADRLYSSS